MSEPARGGFASAWFAWRDSEEGLSCRELPVPAHGPYLENRLQRAFTAGFDAALAPRQQHVPPDSEDEK